MSEPVGHSRLSNVLVPLPLGCSAQQLLTRFYSLFLWITTGRSRFQLPAIQHNSTDCSSNFYVDRINISSFQPDFLSRFQDSNSRLYSSFLWITTGRSRFQLPAVHHISTNSYRQPPTANRNRYRNFISDLYYSVSWRTLKFQLHQTNIFQTIYFRLSNDFHPICRKLPTSDFHTTYNIFWSLIYFAYRKFFSLIADLYRLQKQCSGAL